MVESLTELAMRVCVGSPENTLIQEDFDRRICFRENVYLPKQLCDLFFERLLEVRPLSYIEAFVDRNRCQLETLNLSNKKTNGCQNLISDLLHHQLRDINLSNTFLSKDAAASIGTYSKNLVSLNLSRTRGQWTANGASFLQNLDKLRFLDISFVEDSLIGGSIESISCLKNLVWLDISGCYVQSIEPLLSLRETLEHLYMYDVRLDSNEELICVISQLKALIHLDISRVAPQTHFDENHLFDDMEKNIEMFRGIGLLPKIKSLDISGFPGLRTADLEALTESLSHKLKYLGVFWTIFESRTELPAEDVAGVANENQILTCFQMHAKRKSYMQRALEVCYDYVSANSFQCNENALKLIIRVSKLHISFDAIQLGASACIFHLLRIPEAENYTKENRRSTIIALLDIIESHKSSGILRNCLECLCRFNFPTETEFAVMRISKQLLIILKEFREVRLCRLAVLLFNAIICQTTAIKLEVGRLGAVKILLGVIEDKVGRSEIDNVLETCWCALWNITDETSENCESFVSSGGMELFVECLNEFEDETELYRSMLGLMGNIAEVDSLRFNFLRDDMLEIFIKLLDSQKFDFEVSYNAGGVLSHVCSDGDKVWRSKKISRRSCMETLVESISKWDVGASRTISYRSLKPILRLLPQDHNQCGQEWAIWALANLTKVYPDRYCKLLESEGGLELLNGILNSQAISETMRTHATMVLNAVRDFCIPLELDISIP